MSPRIQRVQSYVTDDKVYCFQIAPDEDAVREHAQRGGFPANRISRIRSVIHPTTAKYPRGLPWRAAAGDSREVGRPRSNGLTEPRASRGSRAERTGGECAEFSPARIMETADP